MSFVARARAIVGDCNIATDRDELEAVSKATFRTDARVSAVVRPRSCDEVQQLVALAGETSRILYPVSRGRNWGFGSRAPTADGAVVVDLGRMDRIVELDADLGYLIVEPGVTFEAVHRAIEARCPGWFLPVGGGPPDGSLIGNLVERGDGVGPGGERARSACALEVVLPTGELVRTGPSRYYEDACRNLSRMVAGPELDGLFLQSRFGIVTRATFWLRPKPRALAAFTLSVPGLGALAPVLDALRELALHGALEDECVSIWNGYKMSSVLGDASRLPPSAWRLSGAVYAASQPIGRAISELVAARLRPVCDDFAILEDEAIPAEARDAFLGRPTGRATRSVYAKMNGLTPGEGPEADGCGLIWVCPQLPLSGDAVAKALRSVSETMLDAGFEPNVGLKVASPRVLRAFVQLSFDRRIPGADERALALSDRLHEMLAALGHAPYRLGIASMGALPDFADDHAALLGRLGSALDPQGVLAPGRYDFGKGR